jgi:hypothetical protein
VAPRNLAVAVPGLAALGWAALCRLDGGLQWQWPRRGGWHSPGRAGRAGSWGTGREPVLAVFTGTAAVVSGSGWRGSVPPGPVRLTPGLLPRVRLVVRGAQREFQRSRMWLPRRRPPRSGERHVRSRRPCPSPGQRFRILPMTVCRLSRCRLNPKIITAIRKPGALYGCFGRQDRFLPHRVARLPQPGMTEVLQVAATSTGAGTEPL